MLKKILAMGILCITPSFAIQAESKKVEHSLLEYTAKYQLKWHGIRIGKSIHSLRKLGSHRYIAKAHSSPTLSFLPFKSYEQSEFILKGDSIYPHLYQFKTQEKEKILSGTLFFDRNHHNIRKDIQGKTETIPLPKAAQDKITYFFQLQQDLIQGKQNISYEVVEPKKIKTYTMSVLGYQTINTAIGKLNTVKIEHVSEDNRRTQLWLAPTYHYLIVKLLQMKRGKIIAEGNILEIY